MRFKPMAIWLALALPAAPTIAQVASAHASITDFQFSVSDLRPTDDVSAGWTPLLVSTSYNVHVTDPTTPFQASTRYFQTILGDRSFAFSSDFTEVSSRTTVDGLFEDADVQGLARAGATTSLGVHLLLTPHTSISMSGFLAASLDCTATCFEGYAGAQANLYVYSSPLLPLLFEDGSAASFSGRSEGTRSNAGQFLLAYNNNSDDPVEVRLYAYAGGVVSNIAPVPDVPTAMSLLIGLGILARTNQRRQAAKVG